MTALPQSSVKFPRKVHHIWTRGGGGLLGLGNWHPGPFPLRSLQKGGCR